jgi:carbamoyltransferase
MIVLGLHRDPWHNSGSALIKEENGIVSMANLSEERSNREKDSRKFPLLSTKACMNQCRVRSLNDIDMVVLDYIIKPDWHADYYKRPSDQDTFLNEIDPSKIHVVNHHLAHAYNTFYSSPFDSAAVLIVDGRGSNKETQSLFVADGDDITLVESTTKIGIGLLYAAVTQAIGFGLLQEGKTMGLAPYGAEVKKTIFNFPKLYDGISTDYGSVCVEGSYEMRISYPPLVNFEDRARAAFEVQRETEDAMLYLTEFARKKTGRKYLCISGGVGLNSVANYKILQSGIFKDIFINPAASDTGIPLGAALYGYHKISKRPKTYTYISPYLGPDYDAQRFDDAIESFRGTAYDSVSYEGFSRITNNAKDKAVNLLTKNKIVACFHGRSEMGPRALGNRSILMSPLLAENKDFLNSRVKHRETFRPFAPVVLEEYRDEYFLLDRPSLYMLLVPLVRPEKRSVIPAVTHVDGTGRLQTVNREFNSYLYSIIERFHKVTGVPVILNTSFNVAREPIVESPEDAVRCFRSTDIDALLIGDNLLVKTGVL